MGLYSYTLTPPRSLNYRRSGLNRLDTKEKKYNTYNTRAPPQTQLATGDVEAGAELGEGRGRETLVKMSANWEVVGT